MMLRYFKLILQLDIQHERSWVGRRRYAPTASFQLYVEISSSDGATLTRHDVHHGRLSFWEQPDASRAEYRMASADVTIAQRSLASLVSELEAQGWNITPIKEALQATADIRFVAHDAGWNKRIGSGTHRSTLQFIRLECRG